MGGKKLTEWPENLKDIIDWFLRVGGKDKESNGDDNKRKISAAVNALGDYGAASSVLKADSTGGTFGRIAEGLQKFIGYNGSCTDLDGTGIGLDTVGGYASSYSNQAKWDENSNNPATYAHILLCSMPLLYFGISYLFWMCCKGWKLKTIAGDNNGSDLYSFMSLMGYDTNKLNSGVNGQQIAELLGSENDPIRDLKDLHSSVSTMTYPEFLKQMNQNGKDKLGKNQAANAPLYVLYAASHAYLQNKGKSLKIMELPQTKSEIAKALKGYSEAVTILNPSNAQKLSTAYNSLLTQIQSVFHPDPPVPPSSSGAAAAGGVLGTAAVGGAGAALAMNVGGITTTLKSLIPIFR
ncbi:variant erythrocyte surface antigen-1 family protein [Babesia caballi]|uniref:Variant erythrocyte surface antigen-1 family protein n=1 Tax=Babesia caballi TaxID=5871 RepID=A0AAV4LNR2_BABCB|nr:variant erythrocyte surface antigen-1 family protein [Babesia caballi]